MNRKQILFVIFIFCLATTLLALTSMSQYGVPFHEALIAWLMSYITGILIILFGAGCMTAYEELGKN